jgi:hypothetical protein
MMSDDSVMNTSELIAAIDAEISRLQQARKLLSGSRRTGGSKRVMSPEARARISAAMKKRWAQQKKAIRAGEAKQTK